MVKCLLCQMDKPCGNTKSSRLTKTSKSYQALNSLHGRITGAYRAPPFELQKATASVFILAMEATIRTRFTFMVSTPAKWMAYQAQGQADSSSPEAASRTNLMRSHSACIFITAIPSRWPGTSQKDSTARSSSIQKKDGHLLTKN